MKHVDVTPHRRLKTAAAALFLWLWVVPWLLPDPAFAHKINLFAWVEGDMVHTQSKFYGGKTLQNGTVQVFDDLGNLLQEGQTDAQGEFSFKAPPKANIKIVVSAGMGHQGVWQLSAEEFGGTDSEDTRPDPPQASDILRSRPPTAQEPAKAPASSASGINANEIRTIVEKELDKKLAPVIKTLSKIESRESSMRDILGGIGYIIGLVGVAAYVAGRKKKDHSTQ